MNCDGCNEAARYMLYEQQSPHCELCYQEALDGCTVPFLVMTYEAWLKVQRMKEMKKREQIIAKSA